MIFANHMSLHAGSFGKANDPSAPSLLTIDHQPSTCVRLIRQREQPRENSLGTASRHSTIEFQRNESWPSSSIHQTPELQTHPDSTPFTFCLPLPPTSPVFPASP